MSGPEPRWDRVREVRAQIAGGAYAEGPRLAAALEVATQRQLTAAGEVRCSRCDQPAGWSLWARTWPPRWMGDACADHLLDGVDRKVVV